ARRFFAAIVAWIDTQPPRPMNARGMQRMPNDAIRVRDQNIVNDILSEELVKLATDIDAVAKEMEEEHKMEFNSLANRARYLAECVGQWLEQSLPGQVYWIEQTGGNPPRLELSSAPVHVGPTLKTLLYDRIPTVIMTSATLSAGGRNGFRHFQDRLGLEEC